MRYLVFAISLVLAGPAAAQHCFGRYYDDAHMRSHPQQSVQEIFFGTLTGQPMLQVRLEGMGSYVYGYADCRDTGRLLVCDLENGQGNFTIEGQGDGTILLRVGNRNVMLERGGDQEMVYLEHNRGDDRVFRLYSGKGCIN